MDMLKQIMSRQCRLPQRRVGIYIRSCQHFGLGGKRKEMLAQALDGGTLARHLTATSLRLRPREVSAWRHATLLPTKRPVYPSSTHGKYEDTGDLLSAVKRAAKQGLESDHELALITATGGESDR